MPLRFGDLRHTRSREPEPELTDAEYVSGLFRVRVNGELAGAEFFVVALDAAHAERLALLRVHERGEVIEVTPREFDCDLLRAALLSETAGERDDRRREHERRTAA